MRNRKNEAGQNFLAQVEAGQFLQCEFELNEEADPELLERAWRQTLDDCPFFERTLVEEDGQLFFAPHHSDCRVERIQSEGAADILPGPSSGRDMAWVRGAENRVRIGVSHALTDGVGKNMFSRLLLYHYFCLKDGTTYPNPFVDHLTGTVNSDADSDIYTDRLFPDISTSVAEEEFSSLCPEGEVFALPTWQEGSAPFVCDCLEEDESTFRRICTDVLAIPDNRQYQKLNMMLSPIGGIDCLASFLMLGRAVSKSFPEAAGSISCRFPINARTLCGKPRMMRNASHAQALAALPVSCLSGDWTYRDTEKLVGDIRRWLCPESVGWSLSNLQRYREGHEADALWLRMFEKPTMLVSSVGRQGYEPQPGRILSFRDYYCASLTSLYMFRTGEKRSIILIHKDSSDTLADALREEGKCT